MLAWMFYVVVVSLLLSGAAFAAERAALLRRTPTRWVWVLSIVASLLLPATISSVSVQLPNVPSIINPSLSQKIVVLRQMTSRELSPSAWLEASAGPISAMPGLDTLLERAWRLTSAAMLLILLISGTQLYWRKRHWERGIILGVSVYIAEELGPAIVGLLRPRIVVPQWLTRSSAEEQELVIAHEQSHLVAHDARLLTITLFLLVCMPWNLPLWWQLRQLRRAIEMDCDARVLQRGHDVSRYGEILIAVGERQSRTIGVVAAMAESKSFL